MELNIAVMGLGYISKRVINGIQYAKNAHLYAVCSRDINTANECKKEYHADKAYSNYDDIYNDENIDLVYICTINQVHYEQIINCLKHHKHVICEKPMLNDINQINEVFNIAKENNCFLMEAHKTAFLPLNTYIKDYIKKGNIGNIKQIKAEYSYYMDKDDSNWVYDASCSGCCYDVGVYPLCYVTFMNDKEIKEIHAQNILKDGKDCNYAMDIQIVYEDNSVAHCISNWFYTPPFKGDATIIGSKGSIHTNAFWKNNECTINNEVVNVKMDSDFTGEIEHAVECINNGLLESPIMGRKQSILIMHIINQLFK